MAEALRSWARPLLLARPNAPLRVVDVGCGLGYVTRWLAAHQVLGPGVELVGVDLNSVRTQHASGLAAPRDWTAGSWPVFHQARMREPVSRHDGVLSARRAHCAQTLLAASHAGAPDYDASCADAPRWRPPLSEVLRPIFGTRTAP